MVVPKPPLSVRKSRNAPVNASSGTIVRRGSGVSRASVLAHGPDRRSEGGELGRDHPLSSPDIVENAIRMERRKEVNVDTPLQGNLATGSAAADLTQ